MRIDWWTLALQTANFLVLVWLLRHFLYAPVMAAIDRRKRATDDILAAAQASRDEAAALQSALAEERSAIAAERDAAMAAARSATEAEREALLRQARIEAERLRADAREKIEAERAAAAEKLIQEAGTLGLSIARHTLERAPGLPPDEAFLDRLEAALAALPAPDRIEIVSAHETATAARGKIAQTLARLLGSAPNLTWQTDPALIAGLELRLPHTVLRHSLAQDLDTIGDEMEKHGYADGRAG